MTFDEILETWSKDSVMDKTQLDDEALKGTALHSKYLRFYTEEKIKLLKLEKEMKVLYKDKRDFYMMGPSKETQEKGWEFPDQGAILKSDIQIYLDGDKEIVGLSLKIGSAKEKVKLLEEIIRTIHGRGYLIKDAIKFLIWSSGG